jgi:hypothetical protein
VIQVLIWSEFLVAGLAQLLAFGGRLYFAASLGHFVVSRNPVLI